MSLLNRGPIAIGRGNRTLRDDRVFVVATDDTYAPKQYFEHLKLSRVKVVVIPTPLNSGHSSPGHVVHRLVENFNAVEKAKQIQEGDEFWVLIDTDHHIRGNNIPGTLTALRTARQYGFEIAASNPSFELWLLLHHEDVKKGAIFPRSSDVEQRIRATLGQYNKTLVASGQFPLEQVPRAIERARVLEDSPDNPDGLWPQQVGTRVYRLLERVLTKPQ